MGYIYVLVEDEPLATARVKIGYSTNKKSLQGRIATHCGSNDRWRLYVAFSGSRDDEASLHSHFDEYRTGGAGRELFHLKPRLVEYLECLGTKWFVAASLEELTAPSFISHQTIDTALPSQGFVVEPRHGTSLFDPMVGPLRAPLPLGQRRPQNSNEWYTPACYVEAARDVMGSIDLDPATSHAANRILVRAKNYYTVQSNGLAPENEWNGNVWLNPPYGGEQVAFVDRCLAEYHTGNVRSAVLCLNGNAAMSGNKWFQPLFDHAICFSGRIKFVGGDNKVDETDPMNNPMNTTCFVYMGTETIRFAERFEEFGPVMVRAK